MKTNRERAKNALAHGQPLDTIERRAMCDKCVDAIESALDEAEQRGWKLRHDADTHYDDGEGEPFDPCAKLNAILDKVIEMSRCQNCHGAGEDLRLSANLGGIQECRRCNGTGDGPAARYIKEARG